MPEEYKISIIIPNYNGEQFLGRCLDSVLSQSEKNVEIIIVDDGSKDHSKEVIEAYKKEHPNIKAVYKENGGVSTARNEGIKRAAGTYTLFLDSDDELEEGAIASMLKEIGERDVLVFSYILYDPDTDTAVKRNQMEADLDGETLRKNLFCYASRTHFYGCWNKLMKTRLLQENNVSFPEGIKVGEDYIFVLRMVKHVASIKFMNLYLYKYYENSMSVTHKVDMNRWKEQALTIRETYQLHPERNEYEAEFITKRLNNTYQTYAHVVKGKEMKKILEKYWKKAYGEIDLCNVKGKLQYRLPVLFAQKNRITLLYLYLWCIDHALRLKHSLKR